MNKPKYCLILGKNAEEAKKKFAKRFSHTITDTLTAEEFKTTWEQLKTEQHDHKANFVINVVPVTV